MRSNCNVSFLGPKFMLLSMGFTFSILRTYRQQVYALRIYFSNTKRNSLINQAYMQSEIALSIDLKIKLLSTLVKNIKFKALNHIPI
jgi:hypothetical protein